MRISRVGIGVRAEVPIVKLAGASRPVRRGKLCRSGKLRWSKRIIFEGAKNSTDNVSTLRVSFRRKVCQSRPLSGSPGLGVRAFPNGHVAWTDFITEP